MSAPPPPRFGPLRVFAAFLFAVGGFVLVWQGFGLAGYGTDWHLPRAFPAFLALLVAGFAVACRGPWRAVKAAAAVAGFGLAAYAWWEVSSGDFKSAVSLREAVQRRDDYRGRLAVTTPEEVEASECQRGVSALVEQYPSLCRDLPGRVKEWAALTALEIAARYEALAPGDYAGAGALVGPSKALSDSFPDTAEALEQARAKWLAAALRARTNELAGVPPADWDGFNGTAFARKVLAEKLPDARPALARAEADWVERSAESVVAAPVGARRTAYPTAYQAVLTLKSLDDGDDRFLESRSHLFRTALDDAKSRAAVHLEAGEYDLAAGTAAAHEITWANHAKALGPNEHKAVTDFRDAYAFLAALAAQRPDPSDVPPPRPKP